MLVSVRFKALKQRQFRISTMVGRILLVYLYSMLDSILLTNKVRYESQFLGANRIKDIDSLVFL